MPALVLHFLLLVALGVAAASASASDGDTKTTSVRTVHLVFSHHLDVGLNEALRFVGFCEGFATKIIQEYFDTFIPRAMRIAKKVNSDIDPREKDGRFAYTIHPWIVSLYVYCVSLDARSILPSSDAPLNRFGYEVLHLQCSDWL